MKTGTFSFDMAYEADNYAEGVAEIKTWLKANPPVDGVEVVTLANEIGSQWPVLTVTGEPSMVYGWAIKVELVQFDKHWAPDLNEFCDTYQVDDSEADAYDLSDDYDPLDDSFVAPISTYGEDTRRGELSDDLGESPDH